MSANNDKAFGYWIDLNDPFLANATNARDIRQKWLDFLRVYPVNGFSPEELHSHMQSFANKLDISLDQFVFGLRLAMRDELIGSTTSAKICHDNQEVNLSRKD